VTLYSVYAPPEEAPDLAERADRLAFVKEGFSWTALIFQALWLIYHRMWLELVLFILLLVGLQFLLSFDARGQTLFSWASLAIALLLAVEANDLRAAALKRKGYGLAGVAAGRGREEAELDFFRAWLPQQRQEARVAPGESPRPAAVLPRGEGDEVIGLFPGTR
jgi:hypothetical protein